MTYGTRVRRIANRYLQQLGLRRWRLTRVYLGIPKHIKKELAAHYPEAKNGFYACVYPTSRNTFVMAVSRDIPAEKLENVIAHEVSHILLHNLLDAAGSNREYQAKNQLEVACDRIANALTRRTRQHH